LDEILPIIQGLKFARKLVLPRRSLIYKIGTRKIGEILHMSMIPDPRYCPMEAKKVSMGMPNNSDSSKNWMRKMAEREKKQYN
jgi:hypothetical protein